MSGGGKKVGPPKHQNKIAWKPKAGIKINETEVGGRFRPLSEITGVCPRCKEQIDWKRRYGKYKPLLEPAKCQKCTKRAVRQAYHSLCHACAKEHRVCAKCCCKVDRIVGRDVSEVEAEQKMLEEAIKNSRERDRRSLLRTMNKDKSKSSKNTATTDTKDNKVGQLFPNSSLEDYAKKNNATGKHDDGEIHDSKHDNDDESEDEDYEDDEDDNDSENEDCDVDDGENEDCDEDDGDNDEHVAEQMNAKMKLIQDT